MKTDLDGLLQEWASRARLADDRAEVIRAAIVESPAGLGEEWWRDLAGHLTEVVVQAMTLPEAARAALAQPLPLPT